jgi:TRAP-type C4-dicarboxylate transport system permease small subunit
VPSAVLTHLRLVEALNRRVGRFAIWRLVALAGVMLAAAPARATLSPPIRTDEMARFLLRDIAVLRGRPIPDAG